MKEITTEQKARAFAMYLHCPIKCVESGHFIANQNSKKDGRPVMSPSILADCWEGTFQFDAFKLLLKPLSEISDEDLTTIAHMYGGVRSKLDDGYLQVIDVDGFVPKYFVLTNDIPSSLHQFLISRGYSVPLYCLGGLDPITAGLAIEQK